MPRGLPTIVREHLEKSRAAAIAAVEVYNKPGPHFRTAHYVVLMVIAWTGLFHAIFYRRRMKPWYTRKEAAGKGKRYVYVDGEVKHWDLAECVKRYYGDQHPPARHNLRFIIGLRNKIEHRNLPDLDPALYGECQSMLMNFEDLLTQEFGQRYSLAESLAVSLQFSKAMPSQRAKAIRGLAASTVKSVRDYIQKFRGGLPAEILNSTEYSFSVYLVPKLANRQNASDIAVEFVRYDPTKPEEMEKLQNVTALIREKQVPVANLGLKKPGQVVGLLRARIPFKLSMDTHTRAWKHFGVRPQGGDADPKKTDTRYCVYDDLHGDYGYTDAWVEFLAKELADPAKYEAITGKKPIGNGAQKVAPQAA
jgi:hypothetical protein